MASPHNVVRTPINLARLRFKKWRNTRSRGTIDRLGIAASACQCFDRTNGNQLRETLADGTQRQPRHAANGGTRPFGIAALHIGAFANRQQ